MAEPRDELTAEEWREKTENARRAARYTYAKRRIQAIVDAAPPLSDAQRERLALLLHPGAGHQAGDGDAA